MQALQTPTWPGLIIMAKRPLRGTVKTRIAAELGNDLALKVYIRLLQHARSVAREFARYTGGAYGWWVAGDGGAAWADGFDPDADVVAAQHGADLGARMQQAFADAFARGWHPVVMMGCDAPQLSGKLLADVAAAACTYDAAIVPAHDGGYVAIALSRLIPPLFAGPDWGSSSVLATTKKILAREHLTCQLFPAQADLDTIQDLCGFPAFDPRHDAD